MTDIHTHILFGIDDGASDLSESQELLLQEIKSGVEKLIFTPHFHPERQEIGRFCEKRDESIQALLPTLKKLPSRIQYKMGAEVFYSAKLFELPPEKLAIQGTPYILLEFSPYIRPAMAEQLFFKWRLEGFWPIIAHAERYPYVWENPVLLEEWAEQGVRIQANAGSILEGGKVTRFVKKNIKKGRIHLVASDAHDPNHRHVRLTLAYRKLPQKKVEELMDNANAVFEGRKVI